MPSINHVLALGASKNIGYFACLRFLEQGTKVTFMLRSPAVFDNDESVQKFVRNGSAQLLKGDALSESDVRNAWEQTIEKYGTVDLCLFTIGGLPSFTLKGAIIDPPNLCTVCLINVLCTYPSTQSPLPRIIILSSAGVTHEGHNTELPFIFKPLSHLIAGPFRDKSGAEQVLAHVGDLPWDERDSPGSDFMGSPGWREKAGMPAKGTLAGRVLVIRAAMMLTDGPCLADSKPNAYRASEQAIKGYAVSRRDVGHFVFQASEHDWEKYGGKVINVSY